jgi:hypothetical protein
MGFILVEALLLEIGLEGYLELFKVLTFESGL